MGFCSGADISCLDYYADLMCMGVSLVSFAEATDTGGVGVSVGVILRQKATDNGVGVIFDEGSGRKAFIYRKKLFI